jgi:hypothetical protein
MSNPTLPHRKTRTVAMTIGLMLGMALGAYAPQMAHAAKAKAPAPSPSLPAAGEDQLKASEWVHYGTYACEFGKSVLINRDARNPGYVALKHGKQAWTMKPVASSTGAIRLEDIKGRALMLQILTKSMLMDQKTGRRLVDGCVHPTQKAADEQLQRNPMPSNL